MKFALFVFLFELLATHVVQAAMYQCEKSNRFVYVRLPFRAKKISYLLDDKFQVNCTKIRDERVSKQESTVYKQNVGVEWHITPVPVRGTSSGPYNPHEDWIQPVPVRGTSSGPYNPHEDWIQPVPVRGTSSGPYNPHEDWIQPVPVAELGNDVDIFRQPRKYHFSTI